MKTVITYLVNATFLLLFCTNSSAQSNNAIRVKISGSQYSDETIVRLLNGATENFDGSYDAWKLFSPNPAVPSIYTRIAAGQELAINSLPEYTHDKSVELYSSIPSSGVYTITIEEVFPIASNYRVSFTNEFNNVHYEITSDSSITLTLPAHQNSHSFSLNISTPPTLSVQHEKCYGDNDGNLSVVNAGNTEWSFNLVDAMSNTVNSSQHQIDSTYISNLTPGSYTAIIESKGIIDSFAVAIDSAQMIEAGFNVLKDTLNIVNGAQLDLTNNSTTGLDQLWEFGDGDSSLLYSPSYTYLNTGVYQLRLTVGNRNDLGQLECSVDTSCTITVLNDSLLVDVHQLRKSDFKMKTLGNGHFELTSDKLSHKEIRVYSINGSEVLTDQFNDKTYKLNLQQFIRGCYVLRITDNSGLCFVKKIIN